MTMTKEEFVQQFMVNTSGNAKTAEKAAQAFEDFMTQHRNSKFENARQAAADANVMRELSAKLGCALSKATRRADAVIDAAKQAQRGPGEQALLDCFDSGKPLQPTAKENRKACDSIRAAVNGLLDEISAGYAGKAGD